MSLSRQQLTLLGIFALFLGPVLLVMLMRSSWWQYQPSGMQNNGHLVQPPVSLGLGQTQGIDAKWLILHVLEQPCDQECVDYITTLRQIHRAAGRNAGHLAIVLLSATEAEPALRTTLEAIYPQFNFVVDSENTLLDTLASINTAITAEPADIVTYILDPMHNVVLAYLTGTSPADIHKDLKRLLKRSDQEGNS
jgi:hypothetical protein